MYIYIYFIYVYTYICLCVSIYKLMCITNEPYYVYAPGTSLAGDAVCCSVSCSVLQCVSQRLEGDAVCCSVSCSVLQCVSQRLEGDATIKTPMQSVHIMVWYVSDTGWSRCIGSPKLHVIFHNRATNYRALLRKMTNRDKASYGSWQPCNIYNTYTCKVPSRDIMIYIFYV